MIKNYIKAARLRTLPLSVSGIIVGSTYAYLQEMFNPAIFILAMLTTLTLQVLSNFANDYGDGVKGTDANRIGEKRMVAAGLITSAQMKKAVILATISALVLIVLLIYTAFGKENFVLSIVFLLLGIGSSAAAIKYTVGNNAYGYSGFGDVFVFVFFGLVSVLGSHFLYTKQLDFNLIFAAVSIGVLSVAVLNLNNMRDIENDRVANKNTLVVKMGLAKAKKYHYSLLLVGVMTFTVFLVITKGGWGVVFLPALFLFLNYQSVKNANTYKDFDPELKKVALSTFALSLLYALHVFFIN